MWLDRNLAFFILILVKIHSTKFDDYMLLNARYFLWRFWWSWLAGAWVACSYLKDSFCVFEQLWWWLVSHCGLVALYLCHCWMLSSVEVFIVSEAWRCAQCPDPLTGDKYSLLSFFCLWEKSSFITVLRIFFFVFCKSQKYDAVVTVRVLLSFFGFLLFGLYSGLHVYSFWWLWKLSASVFLNVLFFSLILLFLLPMRHRRYIPSILCYVAVKLKKNVSFSPPHIRHHLLLKN